MKNLLKVSLLFLIVAVISTFPHSAEAAMSCSVTGGTSVIITSSGCSIGSVQLYRGIQWIGYIGCNSSYNDTPGYGTYSYSSSFGGCSATISQPPTTQCNDSIDNDGNGLIDYPNDPGCTSSTDTTETGYTQCNDSIDNDGNGLIDYPNDPGCTSSTDTTETGYIPPPTTTIRVSSNISATWSIYYDNGRGPFLYTSGSGTSATYYPTYPGYPYTIIWGAVAGYTTPASQTLTLPSGGTITFNGNYVSTATVIDIGLRYHDGLSIVKIAADPQGTLTSPLRIAKNGIVYGIALVNITDPNASKIRIQTSGGVKSLRKY